MNCSDISEMISLYTAFANLSVKRARTTMSWEDHVMLKSIAISSYLDEHVEGRCNDSREFFFVRCFMFNQLLPCINIPFELDDKSFHLRDN